MNRQSGPDRNKPKAPAPELDRAAAAARDPAPGAINRPGFDLGGAVGDAKPEAGQAQGTVKEEAGKARGDPQLGKGKGNKAAGKVRSAVGGVRDWLRGN